MHVLIERTLREFRSEQHVVIGIVSCEQVAVVEFKILLVVCRVCIGTAERQQKRIILQQVDQSAGKRRVGLLDGSFAECRKITRSQQRCVRLAQQVMAVLEIIFTNCSLVGCSAAQLDFGNEVVAFEDRCELLGITFGALLIGIRYQEHQAAHALFGKIGECLLHGRICFSSGQQAEDVAVEIQGIVFYEPSEIRAQQKCQHTPQNRSLFNPQGKLQDFLPALIVAQKPGFLCNRHGFHES